MPRHDRSPDAKQLEIGQSVGPLLDVPTEGIGTWSIDLTIEDGWGARDVIAVHLTALGQ